MSNKWSIVQMKHNGHLTFQCASDYWGTHSDTEMPGTMLPCNVVATHTYIIVLQKSKQTKKAKIRKIEFD